MHDTDDGAADGGKRRLTCPCGEDITGRSEDELVERVREHLAAEHPDHEYSRDQILFMAF